MQTAFQPSQQDLMEFGFHDFVNDSNFDQFAELLRGENADQMENYYPNCDSEIIFSSGWIGNHGNAAVPGDMFELNGISTNSDPNSIVDSFRPFREDIGVDEIDNGDDEYSSETAMPKPAKATGNDRSKTLISERRRRGSMKEKLYALRSLVPNITKMDKASIIGDAVLYVQQLQAQAKNLKAEMQGLNHGCVSSGGRRVLCEISVQQGRRSGGIPSQSPRVPHAFDIQNSNLTATNDKFGLTFTISVRDCGEQMSLTSLKLWVTGALLKQGFEFKAL
ncbi:hypothetical protein Syun_016350 [Stephania yunnanensis]|uniref:BHLH domain-containing protein n=1 Tax=Stephania yunnanensis TaxID=152371 RepID=A0AAP0P246_9MAGN